MDYLLKRREALLKLLPDTAVVLFNGTERPRNYPGDPFPFRPDSHFVYFFGVLPPGAVGVLTSSVTELFLPVVTMDDAVWSGPGISWEETAQWCHAVCRPLSELKDRLKSLEPHTVASLPGQDPAIHKEMPELIGRIPDIENNPKDRALAESIVSLRLYADEHSISELRRACKVCVEAHLAGMAATKTAENERDISASMQAVCIKHGMAMSFNPIISVNGERLHQVFIGNNLKKGDMILADFGAESDTIWASDITNTWPVSGKFSPKQRAVYQIVLDAHNAAVAALKLGDYYLDVHMAAYRAIGEGLHKLGFFKTDLQTALDNNAPGFFFPHGIGHLMGLDVHDMEDLGDLAGYQKGLERSKLFGIKWLRLNRPLKPGMVFTIEPGIYFIPELLYNPQVKDKFKDIFNWDKIEEYMEVHGVRIERDYLMTDCGFELLTPGMPTTPDEIEAFLAK